MRPALTIAELIVSSSLTRGAMTILLLTLSAAGFLIAAWFTLVTYGVVPPDGKFIPAFCRMDQGTCATVLRHSDARALGLPNALYGALFYLLVAVSAVAGSGNLFRQIMILASWIAVALGVYLSYSLLFKIRVRCVLCFTSHAINAAIALLFLAEGQRS